MRIVLQRPRKIEMRHHHHPELSETNLKKQNCNRSSQTAGQSRSLNSGTFRINKSYCYLYVKLKPLAAFCRVQVAKLRSEAAELCGLLKEEHATDSKESTESSGESDGHGDLRQTVKTLRSEARSHRKIIRLLKEQLQHKSASHARGQFNTELNVNIEMEGQTEAKDSRSHTSETLQMAKGGKLRERKEMQEKEEKERQSTKLCRSQKQHMARHAVSVTHKTYSVCC